MRRYILYPFEFFSLTSWPQTKSLSVSSWRSELRWEYGEIVSIGQRHVIAWEANARSVLFCVLYFILATEFCILSILRACILEF